MSNGDPIRRSATGLRRLSLGDLSLSRLLPPVSVAVLTLLAALPWGLPGNARFLVPLLPFAAIHFWVMRRPGALPEWMAFAAGLATDAMTYGPLGFWALIFLAGFLAAHLGRPSERTGLPGQWIHFGITLLLLTVTQWLIASAYFLSWSDWRPPVRGALIAFSIYPLLALLLRALSGLGEGRSTLFDRSG